MAANNTLATQMAALARIDAEDLADRIDWPGLLRERTFATVATISQPGALPTDFGRFAFRPDDHGQLYDIGNRQGIAGPASDAQWRELLNGFSGIYPSWRIFGGVLQMAPAQAAGRQFSFDYITKNIYATADGTGKSVITADTDVFLIPENVITLGVVWRWKQVKGFSYAEELRNAETQIEKEAGKGAGGRRMIMVGAPRLRADDYAFPGVLGSPH